MSISRLRFTCLSIVIAILCAGVAYSQAVSGTLLGTVTDASGAAVPNSKVVITEETTGIAHSGETNESGNFTFPDLPPGRYTAAIEVAGFKKEVRKGIDVAVDTTSRVDLQLQPGNIAETVEVTGSAPLLQTDRADVGRSIDTNAVENLPLGMNRNFQALLNLVPGTTPASFQHSQFFNAGSSLQTEVNGQPRQTNNYQIEGIDDNERTGLLQIVVPPNEAIQTVDVSTNNFEAELGRAAGGVTNVILKSGSNSFHGAAYEFLQNSDLDARTFFNAGLGHVAYNYFGGNVGGPIKKNKLFFFSDYLRIEDHEANTSLVTIPSLAARTGDLSASPTVIYNPFSGAQNGTDAGRVPFPGNQIPSNLINPISAKILALAPAPNQAYNPASPSNNYFAALPFHKTQDSVDAKIDYNVTDKDRLSGRFSFQRPVVFQAPLFGNAGGDGPGGAFMGTGIQKTYSVGINYNRTLSPTLLTEVRVGVAHYNNVAQPSDFGTNDATDLGIPGVNLASDAFTGGIVGISLGGPFSSPFIGYSASLPWDRAEANIDVVNTWTKVKSNHTIKWGVDIRRVRDDLLQDQTYSPRGIYNFGSNQTSIVGAPTSWGNDMASFLLDQPSSAGRDLDTYFPAYRDTWFFAFAGDKWQVSPKLTVDLGLRWELYQPATPHFPGGFSNYDPYNNTLVVAGIGGNPSNLGMKSDYKYFAPRLGLAYRITEKTVVRAGFGISYTPFPDNTYAYNFPVRANNAYNTSPTGNGYGPAVLSDGATIASFQNGFPAPVPVVIPPNGIITPTGTLASSNFFVIPLDYKNPYVESWNIAVAQSLPGHFTLDMAYVGNHGVRTPDNFNLNVSYTPNSGNAGDLFFPRTQSYTEYWRGFSSSYNALQAKIDRRFYNGLSVTTSFTWQKAMDMQTGDDGNLLWYINPHRNWARADFDRTLSFVQSYVYQLPVGPGKKLLDHGVASKIIGGWQVSGILTALTGTPFYITANGGALNTPGETQTANQVAPVQILHGQPGTPWFSTASFTQPVGPGVFGTVGRNMLSGPGMFRIDLSMFKTFQVNERIKLEVRGEGYDIGNTPAFSNPNGSCCSNNNANFGTITGTVNSGAGVNGVGQFGRAFQFGAKMTF